MNELKITIPEGMEIDLEKSILNQKESKIVFKAISDANISYEDLYKKLVKDKTVYYTDCEGDVIDDGSRISAYPNNSISKNQLEKMLAINQLMNIAKYYNSKHKQKIDWNDQSQNKYCIIFNNDNSKYEVDVYSFSNHGNVSFISFEDAKEVIANPNFQEILDRIFKNQ